jgi:Xaa-Pro aminopeptidase
MQGMNKPRLLYSHHADWVYATGISVSDPHPFYQDRRGKTHAVIGALEYAIARRSAHVNHLHSFEEIKAKIAARDAKPTMAEIMYQLVLDDGADEGLEIQVPGDFPARLFQALTNKGLALQPTESTLFPERATKTAEEVEKIRIAQQANEQGMRRARDILAATTVEKNNHLFWQGTELTSEILQTEICKEHMNAGCTVFNNGPIVTCLEQAAIPHERGHGPLLANTFILIDAFPQHRNFYNGDLSRTYLKGVPDPWHKDVYAAVLAAQKTALHMLAPGAVGPDIHAAVEKTLADAGFETGISDDGDYYGFFHSTGHGLGLDLHEPGISPLSPRGGELKPGQVVTVEPGLYYPPGTHEGGVGGCRIEDVAVVTDNGYENLTTLPTDDWVID